VSMCLVASAACPEQAIELYLQKRRTLRVAKNGDVTLLRCTGVLVSLAVLTVVKLSRIFAL
jgi:hypothetical protein